MLANELKSPRALTASIQVVRTFVQLRELSITNSDLRKKISEIEKKYDHQFKIVFESIKELLTARSKPKRRIGFRPDDGRS